GCCPWRGSATGRQTACTGEDEASCPQHVPEGPQAGGEPRAPYKNPACSCCSQPLPPQIPPLPKDDRVPPCSPRLQGQIHPAGAQQEHGSLVLRLLRPLQPGPGQGSVRANGLQQVGGCRRRTPRLPSLYLGPACEASTPLGTSYPHLWLNPSHKPGSQAPRGTPAPAPALSQHPHQEPGPCTPVPCSDPRPLSSSTPSFRAVDAGAGQPLPPRELVLSDGSLQVPEPGRKCLSGSVVSLVCSSCGESARTPRVLGGRPAAIEWWPWQVSLQYRTEHICGGSVIEPGWILTAAHCFKNNPVIPNWRVKAGSDLLSGSVTLAVEKVFLAEVTPPSPKDNDIALVKLQSPLQVSDRIKPICLPYFDEELVPGTSLWVTGWGYTKEHGKLSETLQQAEVKLVDTTSCNLAAYHGEVTEKMLCAGVPQGGVDTCQGDSGGPLMYLGRHWQVVGIVSWGQGCGTPSTPGVYTSVRAYLNWIYAVRRSEL
uniref:Peptidase S1 domain-containing protein n=1 Tax=Anas platyrhynchos TaxID=8839 RepID=A0A8B9TKN5_ANAPL